MGEDLQNQHQQMIRMLQRYQQQQQQQATNSILPPPQQHVPQVLLPLTTSRSPTTATGSAASLTTATTVADGIYDKLHDDLTYINIRLLRSKLSFLHRIFPKSKKTHVERFVNFLIKFIL